MKAPVQITFRHVDESRSVIDLVEDRVHRLERFFDRIVGCSVLIEVPHRHQHHGIYYHARISLQVPGKEIVVNRDRPRHGTHEDIYAAIRDAFDAASRQLRDYVRLMRGEVKMHRVPAAGNHGEPGPLESAAM